VQRNFEEGRNLSAFSSTSSFLVGGIFTKDSVVVVVSSMTKGGGRGDFC
jgi:hypothetical protein